MRPTTILAAAAALAAAPIGGLAALILLGGAAPGPALLAMAGVLAAQAGLALLWGRDLRRVMVALRRRDARDAPSAPAAPAPRFPGLAALLDQASRETRALTDRAAQAETARRAEAAIVEALPEPVLVLAADRRLRRANAAARREFGAEAAAVLRHPALRAALDRAETDSPVQTAELALRLLVTRNWQATVTALPPGAPGGDDRRFLVLLVDRTRERALERMRADFVTNASHELRTPLASLTGFIDTLRGPAAGDPAAAQRFLDIMAEQAGRMERLIADLLSLSRIELNEHQRPAEPVDLAGLATRIAAEFEPRLAARRATLHLDLATDLPPVPGDADQLAQVLQNLLDNALRHGREGGGTIRLAVRPPAEPGQGWPARPGTLVAVADDGPGIPREHLPRLTERFYRVDRGRSRAAGGTGLGLAIVKHVVNRHRGQLRIASQEGAGTSVTIWLPQA